MHSAIERRFVAFFLLKSQPPMKTRRGAGDRRQDAVVWSDGLKLQSALRIESCASRRRLSMQMLSNNDDDNETRDDDVGGFN